VKELSKTPGIKEIIIEVDLSNDMIRLCQTPAFWVQALQYGVCRL